MMFYLRNYPSGCLPTLGLVQKALVLDQRFLAGPAYRARQQFRNVPLQVVVGRNANRVLHASLLQRLISLRLGEGCVSAKDGFLLHLVFAVGRWWLQSMVHSD